MVAWVAFSGGDSAWWWADAEGEGRRGGAACQTQRLVVVRVTFGRTVGGGSAWWWAKTELE